jgi:hypothetical protein
MVAGAAGRGSIRSAVRIACGAATVATWLGCAAPAEAGGLKVTMLQDLGSGWSLAAAFGTPGSPCFQTALLRDMPEISLSVSSFPCSASGTFASVNLYIKHASAASWTDCGSFRWQLVATYPTSATLWTDRAGDQVRCQVEDPTK